MNVGRKAGHTLSNGAALISGAPCIADKKNVNTGLARFFFGDPLSLFSN